MSFKSGYKRVLLLVPGYRDSHYEYTGLPAGMGYLSEALLGAGIEHEVMDMRLGYGFAHLRKKIRSFRPDLIGATMMSFRYRDNYALLSRIKEEFPGTDIVLGGPHLSTFREKVLEECPAVDFGVTLEGEETMAELCSGKKPEDIKGLIYRDGESVRYTGDREFATDLNARKFPRYGRFEIKKYPAFIPLVTSRGCPHSCIFCPVHLTIGKRLRVRSPGSILEEIDHWYAKGVRVFNIVDDNFTFFKERILEICGGIKKKGYTGVTFSCRNGVRADTVDREMLKAMREAGFNYLAFGVESGSERMLKVIKKGETLEDIDSAVKDACDLGYMVTLFFILGLPSETEEDVTKSLEFATRYPVFDVRFYNPIPFPGTELYDWVDRNGYFTEDSRDFLNTFSHWVNRPVFGTPELPVEARKALHKKVNGAVREHTRKTKLMFAGELEKMFTELGVPAFLSAPLSRLYYTEMFQKCVIESGLAAKMKNLLKLKKRGPSC